MDQNASHAHQLALLQAKEDYRTHREECNTCNSDELCDIGGEYHSRIEAIREA